MQESSHSHALRPRMSVQLGSVQCFVEPFQSASAKLMDGFTSATIVGDSDSQMYCGLYYCATQMFYMDNLFTGQQKLSSFLH